MGKTVSLLGALGLLCSAGASTVHAADDPMVVVYYEQWATYARDWCANHLVDDGAYKGMTHVLYGFWAPDSPENGCKLYSKDEPADIGGAGYCVEECSKDGNFGCLSDAKKAAHFKMLLSIGGWTMSQWFSDCIMDANRDNFINSIVDFLDSHADFDGVDLDWEYPIAKGADEDAPEYHDPNDWENYLSFLGELRNAMQTKGHSDKLLTGAVGMDHNMLLGKDKFAGKTTPMKELCDAFDFITLMTYDYFGGFDDITGFHSPLFDDEEDDRDDQQNIYWGIDTWTQACGGKKNKLLVGLPSYGRSLGGVQADDGIGRYAAATGSTTNTEVCKHCGDGTWIDDEAHAFNLQWRNGALSYWDIMTNYIGRPNCKHYFSEAAKQDFFFCEGNSFPEETTNEGCAEDVWCAFDSAESFYEKVRIAKKFGLGGYTMWASADMGTGSNSEAIVGTLAKGKTRSSGFQGVDHYQAALDAWNELPMDDKYRSAGQRVGTCGKNDERCNGDDPTSAPSSTTSSDRTTTTKAPSPPTPSIECDSVETANIPGLSESCAAPTCSVLCESAMAGLCASASDATACVDEFVKKAVCADKRDCSCSFGDAPSPSFNCEVEGASVKGLTDDCAKDVCHLVCVEQVQGVCKGQADERDCAEKNVAEAICKGKSDCCTFA